MAANKNPIATDSAADLRGLIGDDASATFESDPNFANSNPTAGASSEHLELRDTDDTEDSDEEEDEAGSEDEDEEEDDEEDDDDEDEDEDDDEFEDDEEDDDADVLRTAEPTNVHGPGKHSRTDIERELEEMEDEVGEKNVDEAPESDEDEEEGEEKRHADRGIDAALRMGTTAIVELGN